MYSFFSLKIINVFFLSSLILLDVVTWSTTKPKRHLHVPCWKENWVPSWFCWFGMLHSTDPFFSPISSNDCQVHSIFLSFLFSSSFFQYPLCSFLFLSHHVSCGSLYSITQLSESHGHHHINNHLIHQALHQYCILFV